MCLALLPSASSRRCSCPCTPFVNKLNVVHTVAVCGHGKSVALFVDGSGRPCVMYVATPRRRMGTWGQKQLQPLADTAQSRRKNKAGRARHAQLPRERRASRTLAQIITIQRLSLLSANDIVATQNAIHHHLRQKKAYFPTALRGCASSVRPPE